jgi:hypothetical protein
MIQTARGDASDKCYRHIPLPLPLAVDNDADRRMAAAVPPTSSSSGGGIGSACGVGFARERQGRDKETMVEDATQNDKEMCGQAKTTETKGLIKVTTVKILQKTLEKIQAASETNTEAEMIRRPHTGSAGGRSAALGAFGSGSGGARKPDSFFSRARSASFASRCRRCIERTGDGWWADGARENQIMGA